MKSKALVCAAMALIATSILPVAMTAQAVHGQPHQFHHYQLIDSGTFGGPWSGLQAPFFPRSGVMNNRGTLVGWANTPASDAPFCGFGDCYAGDAFQLKDGVTSDLGRIPGGFDSQVNWISQSGLMTGVADNGQLDPQAGFPIPQLHGLLWEHGDMIDLGTLPEGGYLIFPNSVNNRGEVVGSIQNAVSDPNSIFPGYGTQTRAFYWKNGVMQDLGTLGTGTDAIAALINERGQVVGWSYTDSTPSAICAGAGFGFGFALSTGSFIWDPQHGMQDIGGLGGSCTIATDLNNRGQVVGLSAVTGDLVWHPFVWDAATGMTDLGAADGLNTVFALTINEPGVVAGSACGPALPGDCHSLIWRMAGGKWKKTDLGLGNVTTSINASGQVVGYGNIDYLWEDGGPEVDLNTLVSSNFGIALNEVNQINDRGEIAAQGWDANGNHHTALLIPCDENHPDVEGCDYSTVAASIAALVNPRPAIQQPAMLTPGGSSPRMLNRFRSPSGRRTISAGAMAAPTMPLLLGAATSDWIDDHRVSPHAGNPYAHCEIRGGLLTGRCIDAPGGNNCAITSIGCLSGLPATSNGSVTCFNNAQLEISTIQCPGVVNPTFLVSTSTLTPATVSPGGSSTATVNVTAFGGFSDLVAFTCSVTPTAAPAPTCAITPGSVTPGTSATLTVSTTRSSSALLHRPGSGLIYAWWLPLFGLVATGADFGSRRKAMKGKLTLAAFACVMAALVFQSACGSSKPGTPPGAYTVTLTGTDASISLVQSATVTFTVQ